MDIKPCRPKWRGTMTDRERFNRQMHFKSVDRSFNMEFGYWDENYTDWKMFRDNGIKHEWQANEFFSFDRIENLGGHNWMEPCFESRMVEETATHRIYINADGVMAESPKDSHSTIPHYIKPTVVTPEDWKKVKKERFNIDNPIRIYNIDDLKRECPDDRDYPVGIHCGSMIGKIRDMLTFEGLCYAIYDYPEMLEDMVETCCELVEYSLDQLLPNATFDYASGWEDICYNGGPIVSVPFFRDVVCPRYRRISDKLHKYGIDLFYTDCDGDVRPLLPYFLDNGINCLFPYEVNSCAHPGELLDEYPELRIMGGVDKMALGGGKKEIEKYLISIAPYVERGGFIPFCDHRCPPNVKEEDYLYYLDLKQKMFGM